MQTELTQMEQMCQDFFNRHNLEFSWNTIVQQRSTSTVEHTEENRKKYPKDFKYLSTYYVFNKDDKNRWKNHCELYAQSSEYTEEELTPNAYDTICAMNTELIDGDYTEARQWRSKFEQTKNFLSDKAFSDLLELKKQLKPFQEKIKIERTLNLLNCGGTTMEQLEKYRPEMAKKIKSLKYNIDGIITI